MSQDTDNELPPELRALEAELAALVPRVDGLDDACLMFLAGRASARKPRATGLVWPAAFGGMTLVATALAVLLLLRPAPEVIERIVRVPVEPASVDVASDHEQPAPVTAEHKPVIERAVVESAGASPKPSDMLASLPGALGRRADRGERWKTFYPDLRDRILEQGLDSWPVPVSGNGPARPPLSQRELLDELIQEIRRPTAS
jgi:hypothetical protein